MEAYGINNNNLNAFGEPKIKIIGIGFSRFDFPAERLISFMDQVSQVDDVLSCKLLKTRDRLIEFTILVNESSYARVMAEVSGLADRMIGSGIAGLR